MIQDGALKKSVAGMYLDLSASAKGHGVDQVAKLLERLHIPLYMVEMGGEVKAKGGPEKPFWTIGVEAPDPQDATRKVQKTVHLSSHALATSGNYRNFFSHSKHHYSHIIDSRTGHSGQHPSGVYLSVTVLDLHSCMNADAWATALSAMGQNVGWKFAQKHNLAAHFVSRLADGTHQVRTTNKFNRILK